MFNIEVNWFISLIRTIFASIDFIVYTLIGYLFKTIFNLANFNLIGIYEDIEQRVYVILGIFMLFKVTVSLISYLVNPDKMTDKEQGVSKVVTRIITVLVMLIALPTFFDLMTEAQNKLLPVIPRVIIGTANTLSSEDAGAVADSMALTMVRGFAPLEEGCNGTELSNLGDFWSNINKTCSESNNTYAYEYFFGLSTIVGLLMCYVVFSLCISVAIRTFKLIVLKAMAPVPIISYIDPKSSKDGAFSHWSKTFISTWAELFINLGIIYFVIYLINYLLDFDFAAEFFGEVGKVGFDGIILLAFLIVGLLMFAKSAPQFVFDALGIKNKGGFMKMLNMGATAMSGVGDSITAGKAAWKKAKDKDGNISGWAATSAVAKGLLSGVGAMSAGGNAILTNDKPTWTTGIDAAKKYQAKNMMNIRAGYGMGQRLMSGAKSMFGYDIDAEINNAQAIVDTSDKLMKYAIGEGTKYYSNETQTQSFFDAKGNKVVVKGTRNELQAAIDKARIEGTDVVFDKKIVGSVSSSAVAKLMGDFDEGVGNIYLEKVDSGDFKAEQKLDNDAWTAVNETLGAYRKSYANATGNSDEVVKAKKITDVRDSTGKVTNPGIKKDKKSNETKVFKLKQEKGPSSK